MAKAWLICLILVIVSVSGCTDSETGPVPNVTVNRTPAVTVTPYFPVPEPSKVYVNIIGSTFTPAELNITNGTTVRWTNLDSAQHVVNGNGFRSPALYKHDMWNYTFNRTGTFAYNCTVHPSMLHGRVIVN